MTTLYELQEQAKDALKEAIRWEMINNSLG